MLLGKTCLNRAIWSACTPRDQAGAGTRRKGGTVSVFRYSAKIDCGTDIRWTRAEHAADRSPGEEA